MATASAEELRQLSEQAQYFVPSEADRRPSTFLALAPKTSETYPSVPKAKPAEAPVPAAEQPVLSEEATKRRSSSLSSDGAKSASGFRFLKLGPVHWGEHPGDDKTDFHEVAIE